MKSIQVGDRIGIKSSYTRKHDLPFDNRGQTVSVMAIIAIGTVKENLGDSSTLKVDWKPFDPPREWYLTPIEARSNRSSWQKLLDRGKFATIRDLSTSMKLEQGWVTDALCMITLPPDIIEAVDRKQPRHLNLQTMRGWGADASRLAGAAQAV